jgi:hypothetical protein
MEAAMLLALFGRRVFLRPRLVVLWVGLALLALSIFSAMVLAPMFLAQRAGRRDSLELVPHAIAHYSAR